MELTGGMTIQLKKKHPCGSDTWKILRIAQDAKIQCQGCGAFVMISREKLTKSVKKICNSEHEQLGNS